MIRVARIADGPELASIFDPFVERSAVALEEQAPTAAEMAHVIGRMGSIYPFLVCEEEGEILGFARAAPIRESPPFRWSVEDSVYLREGARGRGLGGELLEALLDLLRELGYLRVFVSITLPNPRCIALHERMGFSELCSVRGAAYKLGTWHDLLWMSSPLREAASSRMGGRPLEPIAFAKFAQANPALLEAILGGDRRNPAGKTTSSRTPSR
jgi:phosphinothricin acetyltransferase